ncbi:hypothetical protein chiPu_0016122 [Chiloscyllium punctatum]|uniref:Uncharacterized protein n=1 Tax=Chiloscyllium punctatum TaxID=137246 RepID=A0A401T4P6_CHIPU|nr:hypothetical protein [Chiloscyllium punctatum]
MGLSLEECAGVILRPGRSADPTQTCALQSSGFAPHSPGQTLPPAPGTSGTTLPRIQRGPHLPRASGASLMLRSSARPLPLVGSVFGFPTHASSAWQRSAPVLPQSLLGV